MEFANFEKGHFGHADAKNSVIQLNKDAINISSDTMSKAGFFTSVMAREGFLIDKNIESGLQNVTKLDSETAHEFTMDAFQMQSGVLNDIAKNMGIKFDGEYGDLKNKVNYVARTGNMDGFDITGRDYRKMNKALVDLSKFNNAEKTTSKLYIKEFINDISGRLLKRNDIKNNKEKLALLEKLKNISSSLDKKDNLSTEDSLKAIDKYASLASKLNNGVDKGMQQEIYNDTYELLGVHADKLIQEKGKGAAAVTMGKILASAHLNYEMSGKYYRDTCSEFKKGQAPASFYNEQSIYIPRPGEIDCSGFVSDILSLVGEKFDPYYGDIGALAKGQLLYRIIRDKDRKIIGKRYNNYSRDDYGTTAETFKNFNTLSAEEQIKFIEKINQPGTVMGWTGNRDKGHTWMATGEGEYKNGVYGIYILESTRSGYNVDKKKLQSGTMYRWISYKSDYFKAMNVVGGLR